jgi:hypothetical protein
MGCIAKMSFAKKMVSRSDNGGTGLDNWCATVTPTPETVLPLSKRGREVRQKTTEFEYFFDGEFLGEQKIEIKFSSLSLSRGKHRRQADRAALTCCSQELMNTVSRRSTDTKLSNRGRKFRH